MEIGIKETKELLDFGFKLQKAVSAALENGKVGVADFPEFFPALMASAKAFSGAEKVPSELADLSEEEIGELVAFAEERFDLPNDGLEMLVEETIEMALKVIALGADWAAYRRV